MAIIYYPSDPQPTSTTFTLPDFRVFTSTDERGLEQRRAGQDNSAVELNIQYKGLDGDQVKVLTDFYSSVKGKTGYFSIPADLLNLPSVLGDSVNALRGVAQWRFDAVFKVSALPGLIFNIGVKLVSVPLVLDVGPDIIAVGQYSLSLGVKTNALSVLWQQMSGFPLVFDDVHSLAPTVSGAGGATINSSQGRIFIRVLAEEDPTVYDELEIIPTPTSPAKGLSSGSGTAQILPDCAAIPPYIRLPGQRLPQSPQGTFKDISSSSYELVEYYLSTESLAYLLTEDLQSYLLVGSEYKIVYHKPNTIPISWDVPTCYGQYLLGYAWQENIGGVYTDVAFYGPGDERVFQMTIGTYYRCVTRYQILSRFFEIESVRFRLGTDCFGSTVFNDDALGNYSVGNTTTVSTRRDFTLTHLEYLDVVELGFCSGSAVLPTPVVRRDFTLQRIGSDPNDTTNPNTNAINTQNPVESFSSGSLQITFTRQSVGGIIVG